jgi:FPC/CPF motif-containing protein YcgG
MGLYDAMGSPEATDALADDLAAFAATSPPERGFSTFVASFAGPTPANELEFERLLWAQLQQLHEGDRSERWDSSVSSNPDDAHFSFSLAGRAFFVVGLHAASSRWARRFAWPTLVFNPHDQFNRLRAEGVFDRFRERIRDREHTLQGTLNPNLSDFGERSEARQYSGRPAEDDWRCPFRPKQPGRP